MKTIIPLGIIFIVMIIVDYLTPGGTMSSSGVQQAIAPAVGAALIQGGTSLLQGLFGGGSEEKNRELQRQLMRMQLAGSLRNLKMSLADNQLSRDQQKSFFETQRRGIQSRNRAITGEMQRVSDFFSKPSITDAEIANLSQREAGRIRRDTASSANILSRSLNIQAPDVQAFLANTQIGRLSDFNTGLQTRRIEMDRENQRQAVGLRASLVSSLTA